MAKRLFSYPTDDNKEAEFVGERLTENSIEYYSTPGSHLGFTKPALWIKHNDDFARAKAIFHECQPLYAKMAREQYQAETGYNPQAPFKEQLVFHLHFLYRKRKILPFIIIGFGVMYLYFSMFMGMFSEPKT